jgi:ketol-acid reductoisomerase
LALTLCGLLRRFLHNKGIKRSLVAILEDLGQIKEVALAYAAAGGAAPWWQITLTQRTEDQQALYDALDLGRYRSP